MAGNAPGFFHRTPGIAKQLSVEELAAQGPLPEARRETPRR
jgi:hypothetical protein